MNDTVIRLGVKRGFYEHDVLMRPEVLQLLLDASEAFFLTRSIRMNMPDEESKFLFQIIEHIRSELKV